MPACPYCAEDVKPEALICPHCRNKQPWVTAAERALEDQRQKQQRQGCLVALGIVAIVVLVLLFIIAAQR
jgi:hypothetical protein